MIRFRPNHVTLSASIKDEQIFSSMEDMLASVFDYWSRVVAFMGAADPFRPEEITISDSSRPNPDVGYRNEHKVFVSRMADNVYPSPLCIGYCEMEV